MQSPVHSDRSREGPHECEGEGKGAHPGSGIVFQRYPRISWIDSSTLCRSERSNEQIVRKSWNASFIREMRAAGRLINMSLLFRRSSVAGFKACSKRDIYRGKSRNFFVRPFSSRGYLQSLSVLYAFSVLLYYYDYDAIGFLNSDSSAIFFFCAIDFTTRITPSAAFAINYAALHFLSTRKKRAYNRTK